MEDFEFEPIESLTAELIASLVIHSTFSSLRRARATHNFLEVESTEDLPTLTYIQVEKDGEQVQEVHALSADISRFLLLKSIGGASSESTDSNA